MLIDGNCRRLLFLLMLLLVSVGGCRKAGDGIASDPAAELRRAHNPAFTGDREALLSLLQDLAPGTRIYVREADAELIPDTLSAQILPDEPNKALIPASSVNPVEVPYLLLGAEGYLLDEISFGVPPLWEPLGAFLVDPEIHLLLLKRNTSVAAQVAERFDRRPFRRELRRMAKVAYKTEQDGGSPRTNVFYIDLYEVTTAQYAYFLNDIALPYEKAEDYYSITDPRSKIVYLNGEYRFYRGLADYPGFNVSYRGAKAFCEQYGKRLATFDQWRQALGHWDDGRDFPWGTAEDFENRANFKGDHDGYRLWAPVNAFPEGRSPYGVYNMAGNIWEWIEGGGLVGGAWCYPPEPYGRVSKPEGNEPLARNTHDGFRCVAERK